MNRMSRRRRKIRPDGARGA